jgi:hypothetical protein
MTAFRKGFQDNFDALERKPPDRSPPLATFDPSPLTGALQLDTAEGPSFISLGHVQNGQFLHDVTQRLWTLSIEAMSFELNTPLQPKINMQILAEKFILSTIYVDGFAQSLQKLLLVDKNIFQDLLVKPQSAQSAAARSVALGASEQFKTAAAEAGSRLRGLGMTTEVMSLFPWLDTPVLQIAPQSAGETMNGVWMSTELAQHVRFNLAMKQAESISVARRATPPTARPTIEVPQPSTKTITESPSGSAPARAAPAQFNFISPNFTMAAASLSVPRSAPPQVYRVASANEAESIETGQTIRLRLVVDGGKIVDLAISHEILPKLYRLLWAVGMRAEQVRKSAGSRNVVESFKLVEKSTVSVNSIDRILVTMLAAQTGPMVFDLDRDQARHLAGALLAAAGQESPPSARPWDS